MKRAVIYARYSSDKQNEKSSLDQIRLCEKWAKKNDINVVESYHDDAISGASLHNRSGLDKLRNDAQNNHFDIVICEALDRLSRDQADLATLRKELKFHDTDIFTVQDGEVGAIHIGVKGLLGEMYLVDVSQKTRRGQEAVVEDERIAGGKSYGYEPTNQPGVFSIIEAKANIVRRIFAEFIDGATPRQIVIGLNKENIPSPRGGKWNPSAINGSKSRQIGILNNRLYNGVYVWNRQRFIKDPSTGKRIARLNPESEWVIKELPEYKIIDDDTFNKATAIKAERSTNHSPVKRKKPKYLLSGLTKCGCCGASYTVYGEGRLRCSGLSERGDCSNTRTISRIEVEDRVLNGLQNQLSSPELIREYIKAYHIERKRLKSLERSEADTKRSKIIELDNGITRIVDMVVAGTTSQELANRLSGMEQERDQLKKELALIDEDNTIEMHPGTAEHYRKLVANLQNTLSQLKEGLPRDAVFAEVRSLVEKIVITPEGPEKGSPVTIEVHGVLATLLSISNNTPSCGVKVVAGVGFEPTTFRL